MSDERVENQPQSLGGDTPQAQSASARDAQARSEYEALRDRSSRHLSELVDWHEASKKSGWVLGQPILT